MTEQKVAKWGLKFSWMVRNLPSPGIGKKISKKTKLANKTQELEFSQMGQRQRDILDKQVAHTEHRQWDTKEKEQKWKAVLKIQVGNLGQSSGH